MEKKRRPGKYVLLTLFLVVTAGSFSGCKKETKYRVLTVFFTGVPSPYEEEHKEKEEKIEPTKKKVESHVPKPRVFLHGPFGSGRCYSCHESTTTVAFRKFGGEKKKSSPIFGKGGVGGRLVAPINKLCTQCHVQGAVNVTDNKERWLHGPAGSGFCIYCHGQHNGPYRYMLRAKPDEICLKCHDSKSAGRAKREGLWVHGPAAGGKCTLCHGAHTGSNRYMLWAKSDEICLKCHDSESAGRAKKEGLWVHGPAAGGKCTLCHGAHTGSNRYMLSTKPDDVCVQCHSGGYIANKTVHRKSKDCLSCHNPHIGKDNLLLKKDLNEIS